MRVTSPPPQAKTNKRSSKRQLTSSTAEDGYYVTTAKALNDSLNSRPSKRHGYAFLCHPRSPLSHTQAHPHLLTCMQDFMNTVATECRNARHHPEWTNIYNKTHIRWTTHNPEGLSEKDTRMARFCDEAAERAGELPPDPNEAVVGGKGVEAGDCCGRGESKV